MTIIYGITSFKLDMRIVVPIIMLLNSTQNIIIMIFLANKAGNALRAFAAVAAQSTSSDQSMMLYLKRMTKYLLCSMVLSNIANGCKLIYVVTKFTTAST